MRSIAATLPISFRHRGGAWFVAVVLAGLGLSPSLVTAHPGLEDRLRHLDQLGASDACAGDAHHAKGEALRREGLLDEALAELEAASRCEGPVRALAELGRGQVYLAGDMPRAAESVADLLLDDNPVDIEALLLRARARVALRHHTAAAADFAKALAALHAPQPDHYYEWARACVAGADVDAALLAIDEGERRLGPLVSLRLEAVRIAIAGGRFDAALARIDGLMKEVPPREPWLLLRGEALATAGRVAEARAAYQEVIASAQGQPRRSRAVTRMASEAVAALTRLKKARAR